jgi:hypothetical protein
MIAAIAVCAIAVVGFGLLMKVVLGGHPGIRGR